MQLETLIDRAAERAGNRQKLAKALGVSHSNVSEWRSGKRPCPEERLLAMARMVSARPVDTALAVIRDRLGKLATTSLAGVVAIICTFAGSDDAHAAGFKPAHDNVYYVYSKAGLGH